MTAHRQATLLATIVVLAGCQYMQPKRSSQYVDRESTPATRLSSESVNWNVDYASAITEAREQGKLVLAFFTGSDFCQPCAKLKSEVLDQPEFAAWSADDFVLLELDYPQRTRQPRELAQQNREVAEQFRDFVSGYPTVLILDGNENVLAKVGYKSGGPHAWISAVELQLDSQVR